MEKPPLMEKALELHAVRSFKEYAVETWLGDRSVVLFIPSIHHNLLWPLLKPGGLAGWTFSPVCSVPRYCEQVRAVDWQAAASKTMVKGCHHGPGSPWRCFPGLRHLQQTRPILESSDTVSMVRAAKSLKPEEHI